MFSWKNSFKWTEALKGFHQPKEKWNEKGIDMENENSAGKVS